MAETIKLTKKKVEALKADESKQYIVWDADETGFGVRVSPGGAKSFIWQGRVKGVTVKRTIGKADTIAAEAARKQAKAFAVSANRGEDPRPKKDSKGNTLGELVTIYCDQMDKTGRYSAKAVRNAVTKHVEKAHPRLWKKPASAITLDDCVTITGRLAEVGSTREADKVGGYIKAAFRQAIQSRGNPKAPQALRDFKLATNPAAEMIRVHDAGNSKRALSIAEFRAYWRRVNAMQEPERSLLMFHVLTGGQRPAQLLRATLDDVRRGAQPSITLPDPKGRSGKAYDHIVPLLPETLPLIDTLTASGGRYVFSKDGGLTPAGSFGTIVKDVSRAMEAAGELERGLFTPKHIRQTVESRLREKPYRVPGDWLAQLQSHGRGGVQQRHYVDSDYFEAKLEALEKLLRLVGGTAEPSAQVVPFEARAAR